MGTGGFSLRMPSPMQRDIHFTWKAIVDPMLDLEVCEVRPGYYHYDTQSINNISSYIIIKYHMSKRIDWQLVTINHNLILQKSSFKTLSEISSMHIKYWLISEYDLLVLVLQGLKCACGLDVVAYPWCIMLMFHSCTQPIHSHYVLTFNLWNHT